MALAAGQRRDPLPLPAQRFVLTLWTADPRLARTADAAGVDRIGVDLERAGKHERQRGLGTWITDHEPEDLAGLALRHARRFARVDPADARVDELIALGAEVLMLPMVASAHEAEGFAAAVGGRATTVLLVERVEAVRAIDELVRVDGIDEIHLGLNDLALSLALRNRWQVLAGDIALRVGAT